jgi:predicted acetyltransferase
VFAGGGNPFGRALYGRVVTTTDLRLRPLRESDEAVLRDAQNVMAEDNFEFIFGLTPEASLASVIARTERARSGVMLPPGRVPATFLLAEVGGEIVGRTSIRHRLNSFLFGYGGHIGYGVLPPFRRRGYATEILRQSLVIARSVGVGRALVSCEENNEASARTIERCGGVRDPERVAGQPESIRRYWID